MMRKTAVFLLLLITVLLLLVPSIASAMLLVLSPDKVISNSDVIMVGTVITREVKDGTLHATLRVDRVLKGKIKAREVSLTVGPFIPRGKAPDAFPAEGTRVFTALRGEEGNWALASELNAVAIIENWHVTAIHNGSKIGIDNRHWDAQDYRAQYDQFYRNHMTWMDRVKEWFSNLF